MALSFDQPIIGYGAWNLHFDPMLGASSFTDGLNFPRYLRALNYFKVNHIKVVLFRKSTAEGLPAGKPLYLPGGGINQALIDNLKFLVTEAAATGFWVQICIWHHHAIAKDGSEYPENAPGVLAPNWSLTGGARLSKYYAPTADRKPAFAEHKKLFRRIGSEFGQYENVIFELGNELRVWETLGGDPARVQDERNLKSWVASMLTELRAAAAPKTIRTCLSTAIPNEAIMFGEAPGLDVDFFDFHAGQWKMTKREDTTYPQGITQSRNRVNGYKSGAKLLIDADGLFGPETFQTSFDFSLFLQKWATEALKLRVGPGGTSYRESFVTKGYYPPGLNISWPMLDALELAARAAGL
jgi:hypothetical protein